MTASVSVPWAMAALASMIALWRIAPSGLALLGFLGVVIATHEAGHLVAARRAGMAPTEFYWGFGPEVCAVERGGCRYGLRVLFVGGYVKIHGMTPSSSVPAGFAESGTFRAASHRGRLGTILAGPAVNLATAVVAFAVAAWLEGTPVAASVLRGMTDLGEVITGTSAALWTWVTEIGSYASSVADPSGTTEPPVRFMSPVAQAQVTEFAVGSGVATSLRWLGILSAAIGAINLLPLPPLDGSHAVVAAVEGALARLRPRAKPVRFDVSRLSPLAYATVFVLVFLSLSALVLDLRDIT